MTSLSGRILVCPYLRSLDVSFCVNKGFKISCNSSFTLGKKHVSVLKGLFVSDARLEVLLLQVSHRLINALVAVDEAVMQICHRRKAAEKQINWAQSSLV